MSLFQFSVERTVAASESDTLPPLRPPSDRAPALTRNQSLKTHQFTLECNITGPRRHLSTVTVTRTRSGRPPPVSLRSAHC